jgi:hypothetical protein
MIDATTQPRVIRVIDAEERREDLRDEHIGRMVRGVVTEAVTEAMTEAVRLHMPSAEERAYLGLAVRRAARREKLQIAIIEKSLTGLVWAGLLFIGLVFYEYAISHGWRP